jgi:hypothetical protein
MWVVTPAVNEILKWKYPDNHTEVEYPKNLLILSEVQHFFYFDCQTFSHKENKNWSKIPDSNIKITIASNRSPKI